MRETETEFDVTYSVHYQKPGDDGWYALGHVAYQHPAQDNGYAETTDLNEAIDVATKALDGLNYPVRPGRSRIGEAQRTQVVQHIIGGGPILTFGQPVTTRKTDEHDAGAREVQP